jgi:DNA helicase-2/ATP-dependent DNA helicase PcrA
MPIDLTPAHERILEASGHLLVLGGPGSGKTTAALLKAQRRIEAGLAPGQAVLFLSFSRAAVARLLEASRLTVPYHIRVTLQIQTFHSFFWELLRTHGYLLGAPRRLQLLLPHDERVARQAAGDGWQAEAARLFRDEGRVSFDEFAPKVARLLEGSEKLRRLVASRFPLVIVDEAQDTSTAQWRCVKALAPNLQLLCLGDIDQQIYDWMADVSPERLNEVIGALSPLQVDLEARNHRSPNREIVAFGNDILRDRLATRPYSGITQTVLPPQAATRDRAIRQAVGQLRQTISRETGQAPSSLAVLTRTNRGVAMISRALTGGPEQQPIPHLVLTDEATIVLASRAVALLLGGVDLHPDVAITAALLKICADARQASDSQQAHVQARSLLRQADQLRDGRPPRRGSGAAAVLEVVQRRRELLLSGNPELDWLAVRRLLQNAANAVVREVGEQAAQLGALGLGRRIAAGLLDLWQEHRSYSGAERVLESAVNEEHLLGGGREMRGTSVMTIHKAKAREFDGVVVVHEPFVSSVMDRNETAPYPRSRKLLRVAVTRARQHTILLFSPLAPTPPIMRSRINP